MGSKVVRVTGKKAFEEAYQKLMSSVQSPVSPLSTGDDGVDKTGSGDVGSISTKGRKEAKVEVQSKQRKFKLDDGWPESVEEQSLLLLLVWRHYITRQYIKDVLQAD